MSIKTAVKYQLWECRRSLLIFYGIIYTLWITGFLTNSIVSEMGQKSFSISGLEFSSIIFIFIVGLNYFSESFGMFIQHGLSRKSLFKSLAISIIPIAAFMAILDTLNYFLADLIINYQGMYYQLYHTRYLDTAGSGLQLFEGLLWSLSAYAMMAMIGLFITTLYYRMDKIQKILVSVGIPVILFVILPMVDINFFNGAILKGIGKLFSFAAGYGFNPYYSIVTFSLFFIVFGGLAYLLTRRAVVKG